ncbi:MAG: creatininase family protein, partial [Chloroflexi bacterium]|nr:creatininase family protein [Chloroflexota bacterium]
GSTEQHGPHMPLGTDFLTAEEFARRLGERADVIVTPTIPIGYAKYHTSFPGTLSVSEDTLANMLMEICEDLVAYGATHILFVNGHGGNMQAIRQCGEMLREMCIPMATAVYWKVIQTVNPNWLPIGHGDYVETSLVLALDESLPNMQIAKIPTSKNLSDTITLDTPHDARFNGGSVFVNLITADITDSGDMLELGLSAASRYDIPPTAGSKEMGEKIYQGITDYLVKFVEEFRKVTLPPVDSLGPLAK